MANKTFNDVKMNVEHVDLSTDSIRSKLVSNENISTSLGKIARWYTDIIWSDTKATTSTFGIVKIDGETLKVDDSGTLVVDMISAEQVSLSDYEISEQGGDITQDDTVSSAIGKIEKNVQGKENTILRFTKEEYKTAIEQGKGPKPGELFVITDDYDSGGGTSYIPGEVTSTSANAFRACTGGYGVIMRNDGNYFYFLLTNKLTDGSENHGENWNTLRPFQMQLSTGRINLGCGINVYTNAFDTIRVRRTDGDYAAAISFSNGTTEKVLGYIGMTASANGGLLRWSADKNTSYTFIDTGNIKTYAVPKPTVIYSGSASCGARTTTTVTFKSAAPSDATILKIYWTVSGAVGVSEVDAVNVNVLQNVISASAGTTTNIIQFKIASDRKSMTVGPGTTSIVINEIDALIM